MAAGTRVIRVKFDGDERGLQRSADNGARAVSGWADKLKAFGVAAVAGLAAFGAAAVVAGKEMVDMSNRIADLDRKSKIVFEDQLGDVQKWAEANRKAFGMSGREVVGLAANLADLLKPMGFTAQQAADMSKKVLNLAGALSKWSGGSKSVAEVSDILSAAFLGERDALQSLGISISQAEVDARLLAKGQQNLTGTAQQQAEAVATMELIFEKSADAQKAWAEGGKTAAEAQGTLTSQIETLKEKIAVALTPAIQAVTTFLGNMATKGFEVFTSLGKDVDGFASGQLKQLREAFGEVRDYVAAQFGATFNDLKRWVAENREEIQRFIAQMSGFVKDTGPAFAFAIKAIGLQLQTDAEIVMFLINQLDRLKHWFDSNKGWLQAFMGILPAVGAFIPGLPGRAHGGPAEAGHSYIVGENEPEILTMGGRPGYVTPLSKLPTASNAADSWGPMTIENHIHVGDEVTRVVRHEIRESNRGLKRAVLAGAGAR